MNKIKFEDFLNSINSKDLDLNDFWTLGNATSLSEDTHGEQLEFHRGPLLYALIAYLKPKKILEFGTGGGYSALCMAKALDDYDLDGKIFTIDRVANDEKINLSFTIANNFLLFGFRDYQCVCCIIFVLGISFFPFALFRLFFSNRWQELNLV